MIKEKRRFCALVPNVRFPERGGFCEIDSPAFCPYYYSARSTAARPFAVDVLGGLL
ncbi:MAG: hypothetical protein IIY07_01145 [Thermoguttaceae bacterium]|jgi:hypothetical protein|nr:hypothetical protein [Thermoguttaceae bacterium]